jgi:hypothetical protein
VRWGKEDASHRAKRMGHIGKWRDRAVRGVLRDHLRQGMRFTLGTGNGPHRAQGMGHTGDWAQVMRYTGNGPHRAHGMGHTGIGHASHRTVSYTGNGSHRAVSYTGNGCYIG